LHITATTAIPDAVLTGFALSFGIKYFLYWSGMDEMISVNRGCCFSLYFFAYLMIKPFKLISLEFLSEATSSKEMSPQHSKNLSFSGASFCFPGLLFAVMSWVWDGMVRGLIAAQISSPKISLLYAVLPNTRSKFFRLD
jgi:hypothetical protein